jgi:hypothetical protein
MPAPYSFADTQRLVIKPFERGGFIMLFIIVTYLSQLLAEFIFAQSVFNPLWESSQLQYGIITGIISGFFTGTVQWLVLRKCLPDWKWIIVVAVNTMLLITFETLMNIWKESILSFDNRAYGEGLPIYFAVVIASILFLVAISGYTQWYVLQPYIAKARWWMAMPLIAGLFSLSLFLPVYLARWAVGSLIGITLGFNMNNAGLVMLPAVQAIGFCLLIKKSAPDQPLWQSPLALAPSIIKYRDIQRLQKNLHQKIMQLWNTDLAPSIPALEYLVGLSHSGETIAYEPVDQNAIEHLHQTPLPNLVSNLIVTDAASEETTRLAKFQVVFTPPGMAEINSWHGISLVQLGVVTYLAVFSWGLLSALVNVNPWR